MEKELRFDRGTVYDCYPPFPKNMLIELTNRCNHACVFCHYKTMKRPKGELDKKLARKIMRDAYDLGTREIGFYMMGEPLLKRDLEDYIQYASSLGYEYIYLTTNGALASLDRMKKLIESGLSSVKFSVNVATSEHYKVIHGVDDYLKVKRNIHNLGEYCKNGGGKASIFISFVKTEITKFDIELIKKEFCDVVDKIYFFDCHSQGKPIYELINDGIVERESYIKKSNRVCDMVFNRLHVTSEGYLNACCTDPDGLLNIADLREVSLLEAWRSGPIVDLRRRFLEDDLKGTLCYHCSAR